MELCNSQPLGQDSSLVLSSHMALLNFRYYSQLALTNRTEGIVATSELRSEKGLCVHTHSAACMPPQGMGLGSLCFISLDLK